MNPIPPPVQPTPQPITQPVMEYLTHVVKLREGSVFIMPKVDLTELNEALNAHALQGWRLASSFVASEAANAAYSVVLIFERPRGA